MGSKPFYVVGNWKSHKTVTEAISWFKEFASLWRSQPIDSKRVTVIICPAYTHLAPLVDLVKQTKIPLQLGLQDISPFPSGTYTGAISAQMVRTLASFVLIGHSERRQWFRESEKELFEKIDQAQRADLEPIYCVQQENMKIPSQVKIVAYEPIWSISHGDPYATRAESPESVSAKISQLKKNTDRELKVLYGGSTTPENVSGYVVQQEIDGVLPGGASLDAHTFYRLLLNAVRT